MTDQLINVFWFRRDLRLEDNAGLYHALKDGIPVLPLFVFDRNILDKLDNRADRRVAFIFAAIRDIQRKLCEQQSSMEVHYGSPQSAFEQLLRKYRISKVFTNHDYEPYAITRDQQIHDWLKIHNVDFISYKDQVIFDRDEILKDDGIPYTVFTPYSKKWRSKLTGFFLKSYPTGSYRNNFLKQSPQHIPDLTDMGFQPVGQPFPSESPGDELIHHYNETRDFPGIAGTSRLGVHLRFGTISIRQLASRARALNETFLNELIWRDFYQMILWHFPRVGKGLAFKPEYDRIEWRNNEDEFEKWRNGQTGYPLVDAGMRELSATGYMHNRVRMVVASFLAKHLLIDWRWGEAWFAENLLDYDLAANNGGWQWAAGSGCDAAPYFRIFNPTLQAQKFDPQLKYIRQWVPEVESLNYPQPIVDHEKARKRCLEVYGKALGKIKEGINRP